MRTFTGMWETQGWVPWLSPGTWGILSLLRLPGAVVVGFQSELIAGDGGVDWIIPAFNHHFVIDMSDNTIFFLRNASSKAFLL